MNSSQLISLFHSLRNEPSETEWLEFKENDKRPDDIGQYISALSNSARLFDREKGYLVWGVENGTHNIVGTNFKPHEEKGAGNQDLESWLSCHLSPSIDFRFHEFKIDQYDIVLLEIPACYRNPVRWKEVPYIRIGSYNKKLSDLPEKEFSLWSSLSRTNTDFEDQIAATHLSQDEVLSLLDFVSYFELTQQLLPSDKRGILMKMESENFIKRNSDDDFDITNFGAILFSKRLSDFPKLKRKAVRIISYTTINRTSGGREYVLDQGYARGFQNLVLYINSRLPINEHIEQALRVDIPSFPPIAIRELTANAIIHQDLTVTGSSPMIEIFPDRMEITNPGRPLIVPLRFADEPPRSRNEALAGFMRRVNICEERGTGIDKVLEALEFYQSPAPEISATEMATRIILFTKREFAHMSSAERIEACYWHACLLHVSGRQMTNETLRKRFGLTEGKHNQVGRIIADARKAERIKPHDPENRSPRYARYVPFWA
jgi:ATP-dependent DNA helicase RecG